MNRVKRRFSVCLPGLILLLLFSGCESQPEVKLIQNPSPALRFGVLPFREVAVLEQAFTPLFQWLETKLNRPVHLVVAADYTDLTRLVRQGRVDLGWLPETACPQQGTIHMMTFARPRTAAGTGYYGVIVTRNELVQIDDLQGRRFAFVDRGSRSGFIAPAKLFQQLSIEPLQFFSEVTFSGNYVRSLDGLLNRAWDGAAVSDSMLRDPLWAEKYAARLHVIATTEIILPDPLWVRQGSNLPAPKALSAMFTGLVSSPEGKTVLGPLETILGISGFEPLENQQ